MASSWQSPASAFSGSPSSLGSSQLPAFLVRLDLVRLLSLHPVLIVVGGTGCGKTTQIPQALLDLGALPAGFACAVTQPRRVAAITVAQRVALERGTPLPQRRVRSERAASSATKSRVNAHDDSAAAAAAAADNAPASAPASAVPGVVGYAVRFDDCSIPGVTRIRYVTDGLLLREMQMDPYLRQYAVVIVDEAHERSLATDVVLGMLRQIQIRRNSETAESASAATTLSGKKVKRHTLHPESPSLPPLRIVIMSATLDTDKFRDFFQTDSTVRDSRPPVAYIEGRQFPVTTKYLSETVSDYVDAAVTTVLQIHGDAPHIKGDILVFLTGRDEIRDAIASLEQRLGMLRLSNGSAQSSAATTTTSDDEDEEEEKEGRRGRTPLTLVSLPLYAALPPREQAKVFEPPELGTRKVVWSTNVAETSVTVPGIVYVVDSGVVKERRILTRVSGAGSAVSTACAESLQVVPVSKAAARQRAGRAGREAPGICYRLYTEPTFERHLTENATPELLRSSLDGVVLSLKAYGVKDIRDFDFVDQPPMDGLLRALEGLYQLGALDDGMELTTEGRVLSRFPLLPALAKVVWSSFGEVMMSRIIEVLESGTFKRRRGEERSSPDDDDDDDAADGGDDEDEDEDESMCLGAVLNLVSMLDLGDACPPIAVPPSAKGAAGKGAGDRRHGPRPDEARFADFAHPCGDHVALAMMMESYLRSAKTAKGDGADASPSPKSMRKSRVAWCEKYGVSPATMQRAEDIRAQLVSFCERTFNVSTSGGTDAGYERGAAVRRCVCRGFFPSASRKRLGGASQYDSLASLFVGGVGNSSAISIHPSSCLHPRVIADTFAVSSSRVKSSSSAAAAASSSSRPPAASSHHRLTASEYLPDLIVYTETVFTSRLCARHVSAVDREWLSSNRR